jgi:hypothetical protein
MQVCFFCKLLNGFAIHKIRHDLLVEVVAGFVLHDKIFFCFTQPGLKVLQGSHSEQKKTCLNVVGSYEYGIMFLNPGMEPPKQPVLPMEKAATIPVLTLPKFLSGPGFHAIFPFISKSARIAVAMAAQDTKFFG